ncbi:MAG: hypothetical protein ACE5EK_08375 [Nitrospinales bacterium]
MATFDIDGTIYSGGEEDKRIERVGRTSPTKPLGKEEGRNEFIKIPPENRGIVLSFGSRRSGERRTGEKAFSEEEHRKTERRGETDSKARGHWSPQTHQIMVVAIPNHGPHAKRYNVGDEVYILPAASTELKILSKTEPASNQSQNISDPSVKEEDKDFVVHLTNKYPGKY